MATKHTDFVDFPDRLLLAFIFVGIFVIPILVGVLVLISSGTKSEASYVPVSHPCQEEGTC